MDFELVFRSRDGVLLSGTLTRPASARGLVLLIHGVHGDREEHGFYGDISEELLKHGLASFRFDWRCHGVDAARPIQELSLAGILNDIDAAARSATGEIGSPVSGVVAASFSGGVAAEWCRGSGGQPTLILLNPVLDYESEYLREFVDPNTPRLSSSSAAALDHDGWLISQRKQFSRSAINELHAFRYRIPEGISTWIIHGEVDTRADLDECKRLVARDSRATLLVFPGVDHGFYQPGAGYSPQTRANQSAVAREIAAILETGADLGHLPRWDPASGKPRHKEA